MQGTTVTYTMTRRSAGAAHPLLSARPEYRISQFCDRIRRCFEPRLHPLCLSKRLSRNTPLIRSAAFSQIRNLCDVIQTKLVEYWALVA